jgi:hypothetical protein
MGLDSRIYLAVEMKKNTMISISVVIRGTIRLRNNTAYSGCAISTPRYIP